MTDQLGNTTTIYNDDRGNVIKEVSQEEAITLRTYDSSGNMLTETQVVKYNGQEIHLTTSYTYDADGNKLSETDARGNVTRYNYNQYGQLLSTGYDRTTLSTGGIIMSRIASMTLKYAIIPLAKGAAHTWMFSMFLNFGHNQRNQINKQAELGKGGYDATVILDKLRNSVILEWNKLSTLEKTKLIDDLHSFKHGVIAWDIHELTFSYKKDWTKGMVGDIAHETLTYKGKVYPVAEVNYLLWGMLNRLAYEDGILSSPSSTYYLAGGYRTMLGGVVSMLQWGDYYFRDGNEPPMYETISGKIAWVDFGWNWAVSEHISPPIHESLPNAIPNQNSWTGSMGWSAGGTIQNRMLSGNVH